MNEFMLILIKSQYCDLYKCKNVINRWFVKKILFIKFNIDYNFR